MRELVWVGGKMHVSWETTLHYLFERKASFSLLPHRTKSCLSSWLIYDRLWQKQKFWQAEKRSRSKWVNNNPQSIDWFWGLQVPTQSNAKAKSVFYQSLSGLNAKKEDTDIPIHVKSKKPLSIWHTKWHALLKIADAAFNYKTVLMELCEALINVQHVITCSKALSAIHRQSNLRGERGWFWKVMVLFFAAPFTQNIPTGRKLLPLSSCLYWNYLWESNKYACMHIYIQKVLEIQN